MAAVPYKNSGDSKKKQVAGMFNNISPRYDFLNHLFSFNLDKCWRRKAITLLKPYQPKQMLDLATGTADFAIAASGLHPERITGIDISEGMLHIAREKIVKKNLTKTIGLKLADSEALPFNDNYFDAAIVGFGVRNFESPDAGIREVYRVLKAGAPFLVLEFSKPGKPPFKQVYRFYIRKMLPLVGHLVSKDRQAYAYLPESVEEFPSGENFTKVMIRAGFINNRRIPMTFGVATVYMGEKPKSLE